MNRPGGNPVVTHLLKRGRRVTEESYLQFAYPDGVPNPLSAELKREAEDAVRQSRIERSKATDRSKTAPTDDKPSQSLLPPNLPRLRGRAPG